MDLLCYVSLDGYNLNPVIHLVIQLIIGPEYGLVHISAIMTLEFSNLGTTIPLSNLFCKIRVPD